MTLNEIRIAFRNKAIGAAEALEELSKQPVIGNKAAEALLDELLGISAEPAEMTEKEQALAEAWENGHRGSDNG